LATVFSGNGGHEETSTSNRFPVNGNLRKKREGKWPHSREKGTQVLMVVERPIADGPKN